MALRLGVRASYTVPHFATRLVFMAEAANSDGISRSHAPRRARLVGAARLMTEETIKGLQSGRESWSNMVARDQGNPEDGTLA